MGFLLFITAFLLFGGILIPLITILFSSIGKGINKVFSEPEKPPLNIEFPKYEIPERNAKIDQLTNEYKAITNETLSTIIPLKTILKGYLVQYDNGKFNNIGERFGLESNIKKTQLSIISKLEIEINAIKRNPKLNPINKTKSMPEDEDLPF